MRTIRATRARAPTSTSCVALPGVTNVEPRGEAFVLTCTDSDSALRALLPASPRARDIEVTGAGLEEAFMQLTADAAVEGLTQ